MFRFYAYFTRPEFSKESKMVATMTAISVKWNMSSTVLVDVSREKC